MAVSPFSQSPLSSGLGRAEKGCDYITQETRTAVLQKDCWGQYLFCIIWKMFWSSSLHGCNMGYALFQRWCVRDKTELINDWIVQMCVLLLVFWTRGEKSQGKNTRATQAKYSFWCLPKRNDTGGNKLTRQVNKRLMHSITIKIILILLQTKHATNAHDPT